jgi:hypothetical protein
MSSQAAMMSSSSQSPVALNIMAMAWQWSLTALLNRSMLPSPRRFPRPDGSKEGISTSAAQSAVSSQQSAVSSQQSAVSSRHAHRTSARSAGMAKSRSVTFDSALMYAKQKGRNVCTFLNDC